METDDKKDIPEVDNSENEEPETPEVNSESLTNQENSEQKAAGEPYKKLYVDYDDEEEEEEEEEEEGGGVSSYSRERDSLKTPARRLVERILKDMHLK